MGVSELQPAGATVGEACAKRKGSARVGTWVSGAGEEFSEDGKVTWTTGLGGGRRFRAQGGNISFIFLSYFSKFFAPAAQQQYDFQHKRTCFV